MDRIFAGWRLGHKKGETPDGKKYIDIKADPPKTLFETIEQSTYEDEETYILERGEKVFSILNVYPYTTGHLMVLPKKAHLSIIDLDQQTYVELWNMVQKGVVACKSAFGPDGLNIGINEGDAGGGSIVDHLHVHIVPRWRADTNFLTSVAETRILPMTLKDAWMKLKDCWPDD